MAKIKITNTKINLSEVMKLEGDLNKKIDSILDLTVKSNSSVSVNIMVSLVKGKLEDIGVIIPRSEVMNMVETKIASLDK